MVINKIELKNYRLHSETKINFSKHLNYIVGGNGQGKTSLIESIYYLCTSKNLTQSKDLEVVSFNESYFNVIGNFTDLTNNSVRVYFNKDENKKSIFVDEKNIGRAANLIGKFPVVTLIPANHLITQGSPGDRRKYFDSVISQASSTYLKILLDYNRTLKQRSSLLNQIKESKSKKLFDELNVWTESLVNQGTEIIEHRIKFLKIFKEYIQISYKKIMDNLEIPSIEYSFLNNSDISDIRTAFNGELKKYENLEIARGTNLVGPHRDEFIFRINKNELKKYGSQGQHKTFLIALRFGEFFYLKNIIGRTPIFLMDDIFGELDAFRANKISEYLKEIGQAFITLTDLSNFDYLTKSDNDFILNIKNGQITNA
ncbi:MAG: DNA replication and repair protein RecF [Bacteroidetes bacterium]|nr:DNA replication and repair protein RecF [Bacteroidota bacterium]MBU1114037.1 DNA replication and repair protein RecF [Bacteroidota bacterium]MBU1796981.1 DNA replication and repair protein RecF [Bacteroidota bacterium]